MVHISHNNATGARDADIVALTRDLEDSSGKIRLRARQALVDIGGPAVPALELELSSPVDQARWEAAKALCEIHAPGTAPALVQRLDDEYFSVRWLAAEALISMGTDAIIPLLEALVRRSESIWLRRGAHHVLRELYKRQPDPVLQPVLAALEDDLTTLDVPIAAENALMRLEGVG